VPKNVSGIRIVSIADGSERTIIVPHWPEIGAADWAADAKSIWVVALNRHATGFREDDGAQALLNVNLNGKITDTLESDAVRFYWTIPSPDGRRLALNGSTTSSNVWLLENF
jgi:hypothetical protein